MAIPFFLIIVLIVADVVAFAYLSIIKKAPAGPVINLPLIRQHATFRKAILSMVMRHYMSHDANLGYRFKANTKPFRLLHRLPGNKKRFKEVSVKNFFEFRTDDYGFISNTLDQKRDYATLAKDNSVYKILVCGASVTAGYGVKSGEHNWPALLEKALNSKNELLPPGYREVAVFNTSSLGSHVVQELRRFQDETIFLNPDMVILFSAGGMTYDYVGNPVDIGFHEEQKKMNEVFNYPWYARSYYVLPNITAFIRGKYYSPEKMADAFPFRKADYVNVTAAQYVLSKVRQFKGICDTHDMDFVFIMQPFMGAGEKTLTKQELALVSHFERYFFGKNWDEYLKVVHAYLAELRPNLKEPYQYDYLDVFKDVAETTYSDPRHQNELGHQILADKIEKLISERWYSELNLNAVMKNGKDHSALELAV